MKVIVGISLFVMSFTIVRGQDFDKVIHISWDVNMPLSNREWIDETSARGLKAGYHRLIEDKFLAGIELGWATYDKYQPTVTFEYPGGAFTTDYFNYLYSYGLTVSGGYVLPVGKKEKILPYAGLGLGASLHRYTRYYNIYQDMESSWGFLVSPKVGAIIPFGRKIGAMAAVHYDFSTSKQEAIGYNNFSNIGVQVGIVMLSY